MIMLRIYVFFAISAIVAAAPASGNKQQCQPTQTVALSSSGWSIPLTSLADSQRCSYTFRVPENYFASVELKAYGLELSNGESIQMYDNFNTVIKNLGPSLTASSAFATDFNAIIQTSRATRAQISIVITIQKADPQENIVKSYITFGGSSSSFLYASEWTEGSSYRFTSKTGSVSILAARDDINNYDLSKIFVYDNGVFVATLLKFVQGSAYTSTSNNVLLYLAKKATTEGIAMITDSSNIDSLQKPSLLYLNLPQITQYLGTYSNNPASMTVVVPRNKSVRITGLQDLDENPVYSYNAGGPGDGLGINIDSKKLPVNVSGSAVTVYVAGGEAFVSFAS